MRRQSRRPWNYISLTHTLSLSLSPFAYYSASSLVRLEPAGGDRVPTT